MSSRWLRSVTLLCCITPIAEVPARAAPLTPAGKWLVEGQDNVCALSRPFEAGFAKVTVGVRPSPLGDKLDILLFMKRSADVQTGLATLQIDGSDTTFSGTYVSYKLADRNEQQITFPVDYSALSALPSAAGLTIKIDKRPPLRIEPLEAANAGKVLAYCQDQLRKQLGIDPAAMANVTTQAIPTRPEQSWFTTKDYPSSALSGGAHGVTRLLLTIGDDGRISNCVPYGSTGNTEIDKASCSAFKQRGHYTPAKDQDGNPLVSYQESSVRWVIPD